MYDLIIIGAGPAGLTASIYASCFHLEHLVISTNIGGQLLSAPDILNYPGFESISGKELTEKMLGQMKKRGGEVVTGSVTKIQSRSYRDEIRNEQNKIIEINGYEIETLEGNKYQSRAIILATGTERRKLGVTGEVEYTAKGVHYCATCEKFDYEGKVCVVIGGGNSAVQAAVELAQAAKKVYIIYRGSELRGEAVWLEQIQSNKIIEVVYKTVVEEIIGDGEKVTELTLRQLDKGIVKQLRTDKIFIEIGGVPGSALIIPLGVKIDKVGRIAVDERLSTNIPGVFACGDLVSSGLSIEQITSAVGLGARAAFSAFTFIKNDKAPTIWGKSQIKR